MKNWRLQGATEAQNLKAVKHILQSSPYVLFAERRNSGAVSSTYKRKDGLERKSFVQFQQILRWPGTQQAILDCEGWLVDGRYFGLEIKSADWVKPTDARERAQSDRIRMINAPPINGVAAFVTNPDQVLEMIKPQVRRAG